MKWIILPIIRLYQKTLSLDHGPFKHIFPGGFCKFYPSCSQYGYDCVQKHGAIKGSFYTVKRILRCNPFSHGGIDYPPGIKKD